MAGEGRVSHLTRARMNAGPNSNHHEGPSRPTHARCNDHCYCTLHCTRLGASRAPAVPSRGKFNRATRKYNRADASQCRFPVRRRAGIPPGSAVPIEFCYVQPQSFIFAQIVFHRFTVSAPFLNQWPAGQSLESLRLSCTRDNQRIRRPDLGRRKFSHRTSSAANCDECDPLDQGWR